MVHPHTQMANVLQSPLDEAGQLHVQKEIIPFLHMDAMCLG